MSLSDGKEQRRFERSDTSKALLGFLSTFTIAVATKLISMLFASQPVTDAMVYLSENYSFWFSILGAASSSAYFAVKWTKK